MEDKNGSFSPQITVDAVTIPHYRLSVFVLVSSQWKLYYIESVCLHFVAVVSPCSFSLNIERPT